MSEFETEKLSRLEVMDQKLDRILEILDREFPPPPEPEVCDHTIQDFVSRDGYYHCEHCNMRLKKDRGNT